jgi:hypothetical protein
VGAGVNRELQEAIRRLHGCESRYVEAVPVSETFEGQPVWTGIVHVFDLIDCPEADRAYAWAELLDEVTGRQRFVAVLHKAPVDSPVSAVRASIVRDYRNKEGSANA